METNMLYALTGLGVLSVGLYALFAYAHLLRRILALNIMSSGVFMVLIANAYREKGIPDPVPHALVLTGIVVAVSATALGLILLDRIRLLSGATRLSEPDQDQ